MLERPAKKLGKNRQNMKDFSQIRQTLGQFHPNDLPGHINIPADGSTNGTSISRRRPPLLNFKRRLAAVILDPA